MTKSEKELLERITQRAMALVTRAASSIEEAIQDYLASPANKNRPPPPSS